MTAPSAISASKLSVYRHFCSASGASSAPGTLTIVTSLGRDAQPRSAPPCSSRAEPSPMSALKRADDDADVQTSAFGAGFDFVHVRRIVVMLNALSSGFVRLQIAGRLQIESRHARHSTRLREQTHFATLDRAISARRCRNCADAFSAAARSPRQRTLDELARRSRADAAARSRRISARRSRRAPDEIPRMGRAAGVEQVDHRQRLVHAHQRLRCRA